MSAKINIFRNCYELTIGYHSNLERKSHIVPRRPNLYLSTLGQAKKALNKCVV